MPFTQLREIKPFTHPKSRTTKKIIISTEGSKTEPRYFKALASLVKENISFIFLERNVEGHSAPKYIVGLIDEYIEREVAEFGSRKAFERYNDEYWVVIDQDSWADLPRIARECRRKGYNLAISNPCFELWILMHFIPEHRLPELRKLELYKDVQHLMKQFMGGYSKSRFNFSKLLPRLEHALQMAELMELDSQSQLPGKGETKVHHLVRKLTV